MTRRAEVWTLWSGERPRGTITITGGDFPWLHGSWSPTDAFRELEPLFREELRLVRRIADGGEASVAWGVYERIRAAVTSRDPDGAVVPEVLLHIDPRGTSRGSVGTTRRSRPSRDPAAPRIAGARVLADGALAPFASSREHGARG